MRYPCMVILVGSKIDESPWNAGKQRKGKIVQGIALAFSRQTHNTDNNGRFSQMKNVRMWKNPSEDELYNSLSTQNP